MTNSNNYSEALKCLGIDITAYGMIHLKPNKPVGMARCASSPDLCITREFSLAACCKKDAKINAGSMEASTTAPVTSEDYLSDPGSSIAATGASKNSTRWADIVEDSDIDDTQWGAVGASSDGTSTNTDEESVGASNDETSTDTDEESAPTNLSADDLFQRDLVDFPWKIEGSMLWKGSAARGSYQLSMSHQGVKSNRSKEHKVTFKKQLWFQGTEVTVVIMVCPKNAGSFLQSEGEVYLDLKFEAKLGSVDSNSASKIAFGLYLKEEGEILVKTDALVHDLSGGRAVCAMPKDMSFKLKDLRNFEVGIWIPTEQAMQRFAQ